MEFSNEKNMAYQIKYEKVGDEVKAYLAEIPTTCAFGKNEKEAFINLIHLLHGEREN
jgi:hypothetical protein